MTRFNNFFLCFLTVLFLAKRDTIAPKEKHQYFLENSPYKTTKNLSRKARKSLAMPPNAYHERFYELTMNPNLGYPTLSKKVALQNNLAGSRNRNVNKGGKNNSLSGKAPGVDNLNPWTSIGPNDVGGRTRAALFDLNDNEKDRVIAGGVSGGLWVNEDIDSDTPSEWIEVTGVPGNLAVSVLIQNTKQTNHKKFSRN